MKHCIIGLILISILSLIACKEEASIDPFQVHKERLMEMLQESAYDFKNKKKIVFWATSSCQGCRATTVNTLMSLKQAGQIEVIVPKNLENSEASYLAKEFKFIDENNIFGQKYFGISNVGIIYLDHDTITKIRNYDANQMKEFEQDLLKE